MCGIVARYVRKPSHQDTSKDSSAINENGGGNINNSEEHERRAIEKKLRRAIDTIKHRGPDGNGTWVSADGSVGLGHCRLAIQDLSPAGRQPLHSDDGLIHTTVNGEIYDCDHLRQVCELEHGYRFRSTSDSELVLALYEIHGAPGFFPLLRGEFAFVLFDERGGGRRLIAARDRHGVKPIYWSEAGDEVIFASEVKALPAMGHELEWDVKAISEVGWLMDERTIYKGVRKIQPGHWLEMTDGDGIEIRKYWDAEYPDKREPNYQPIDDMILEVRRRLVEAVRVRLRADVPIGVYLSGGIDSSAMAGIVTELARKEDVRIGSSREKRVTCYTVKFPGDAFDESSIAERTAEWLGVDMVTLDANEDLLARNFADAAYHYEQSNFDLGNVAKFSLSGLPQERGMRVVITGEGSDEHFAGYNSLALHYLSEPDGNLPDAVLTRDPELRKSMIDDFNRELAAMLRAQGANTATGVQSSRAPPQDMTRRSVSSSVLAICPPNNIFSDWVHEQHGGDWDPGEAMTATQPRELRDKIRDRWHPLHTSLYTFGKTVFPNVILGCLGDRSEMAHSVEGRTPFLDHHLVEYVNALPPGVKIRFEPERGAGEEADFWWQTAGTTMRSLTDKWILRQAVRPYVTEELYRRRKVPFSAPTRWAKGGALYGMFNRLLTREAVDRLGFINYEVLRAHLDRAFGEDSVPASFRTVCHVGGWVVLSQRLGIKKAVQESGWAGRDGSHATS